MLWFIALTWLIIVGPQACANTSDKNLLPMLATHLTINRSHGSFPEAFQKFLVTITIIFNK